MKRRGDIVVVGAGPAGISAALEAARAGRSVTLVGDAHVGGRAMHASLLPSKALLRLAELHRADVQRNQPPRQDAAAANTVALVTPAVMAQFGEDLERLLAHQLARATERLTDAGVRVLRGTARFLDAEQLELESPSGTDTLTFERLILATGSVPELPASLFGAPGAPDGVAILTPRHVRQLRSLPQTMLVVGGGATGAEAVSALTDLGVQVTWMLDDLGILPRFDRELASSLGDVLMERGVKIVHGKRVLDVTRDPRPDAPPDQRVLAKLEGGRTYAAERALVAVGRRPDLERLRLEAAGIELDPETGAVRVDAHGRSSHERVYAVGDATGAPFLANKAQAQGWHAARHATGRAVTSSQPAAWIETVYARPELASVGVSPQRAAQLGQPFEVRVASYESSLRGALEGAGFDRHVRGTVKVVLDATERITGATAIGPHAAEVLAPLATAIHLGAHLEQVRDLFLAEPTMTSIAFDALR